MWPWLVKMPTQNLLRLLLLLVLILRSWSLVMKSNFCPDFARKILVKDFEAEVKTIFCCWPLVAIMKIILGRDSEAMYGLDFEVEPQARFWSWCFAADPCLRFRRLFLVEILKLRLVKILKFKFSGNADISNIFGWSCCLVEIMKMKYDQDFFENLWNDLKKLLW